MYTQPEKLVAKLEKSIQTFSPEDRDKALSLMRWYSQNGDLTQKQRYLAKGILKRKREQSLKEKTETPYYVYVISDGEFVKIGYSKNPKKRLKAVQSGNPRQLKLAAKKEVQGRRRAKALEKSLHKQYGCHRKAGEWFCGSILEQLLERFKS